MAPTLIYIYCDDDPINLFDPTGHWGEEEAWGEELAAAVKALGRDGQSTSHSTATNYLGDVSIGANSAVERPAPTEEEVRAVPVIQRTWRKFAGVKKQVPGDILTLVQPMGEKMTNAEDFRRIMLAGRILVQANGEVGDPLAKHSALYFESAKYEISLLKATAETPLASKYGISPQMAQFMTDRNSITPFSSDDHSVVWSSSARSAPDNLPHLAAKGRMFILDAKYSAHFQTALDMEGKLLTEAPYSYGIHYNCHVFVWDMLRHLNGLGR